ncbi:hypothetical protein [Flexibacterium corallicola]|uniref:hypothetical protein n=1 Tax=Flexibacterium corallicola TaxID=3037259 RepID=UPI00286EEB0C|nr:hypothetical protein [Pseudovibrio sp. M1P-2-3]
MIAIRIFSYLACIREVAIKRILNRDFAISILVMASASLCAALVALFSKILTGGIGLD